MPSIHSVPVRSLSNWLLTQVVGVLLARGQPVGILSLVLFIKGEAVC